MTLVDDARRLLSGFEPFFTQYHDGNLVDRYWFCGGTIERPADGRAILHHADHCRWAFGERIIAALEAAERVAAEPPMIVHQPGKGRSLVYRCAECRELLPKHAPECSWQALAAAMKEPEA